MTDFQLLIEFCDRFGYDYKISELYDGGHKVYSQGEEYYFDPDGMLTE
jgi:hypothetical protein